MRSLASSSLARRWLLTIAVEALLFIGPFQASAGKGPLGRWLATDGAPPVVVSRSAATGTHGGQVATVTMGNAPRASRRPESTSGGQLTLLLMLLLLGRTIAATRDARWRSEERGEVE